MLRGTDRYRPNVESFEIQAKTSVTVDWLLLTRWRSVVRHVTMRARATRRVVS